MTIHATTVLCVRHRGKVAMGADGQVTLDRTVMKHTARKIRRLYKDSVLAGFAGASVYSCKGVSRPSGVRTGQSPAEDAGAWMALSGDGAAAAGGGESRHFAG